ncbi:MAG: glycosyltransferase family 4 protein [Planctomycetes bacterium]|nr:glycosyltransferase family 4 protein [Planctomycetota bacterium]
MSVLRVALDYRPALLGRSGIPRAVRELARALGETAASTDLDVRLFGHSWARASAASAPRGTRLFRTRLPGRALPFLARLGLGAERLCGAARVFHWTDYIHPPIGRHARAVLTLHDCAFAVDPDLHGDDAAVLRERTLAAIRRASLVVCPTHAAAHDAHERLGVAEAKLRVVPFGADHSLATATAAPPFGGDDYVLMLGTIEPRKNHLRAIAAWRALAQPRPRLVVVGRAGWRCDAAVAALRDAVLHDGALWFCDADDSTLAVLLAHARVLLYPSLLEGFGFPPLEALRCGVPVVAGDTAALRETCGDAATFCAPRDVDSIREALHVALSSDALTAAAHARRQAQAARFRWRDCALAHASVYREALA